MKPSTLSKKFKMENKKENQNSKKYFLSDIFAGIAIFIVIMVRLVYLASAPQTWVTRYGGIIVIVSTILSWILLEKENDGVGQFLASLVSVFVILYFIIVVF